jgi:hypothetical protein
LEVAPWRWLVSEQERIAHVERQWALERKWRQDADSRNLILEAELERVTAALREIERTAAGEADAPLRDFARAALAGGARAAQEDK